MPAKKDTYWEEELRSLRSNNPTWGAGRIKQGLEQKAADNGREDAPGERWVGNFLKKLKEDPNWPQEESEYRTFYWPESMEREDLPWSASRVLLDFLAGELHERQPRPNIRVCKWYWRLYQAAGDLSWGGMEMLAKHLAIAEVGGTSKEDTARRIEGWLAFAPWTNERTGTSGIHMYRDAIENNIIPSPEESFRLTVSNAETQSLVDQIIGRRKSRINTREGEEETNG